jgi:hypothetical protein
VARSTSTERSNIAIGLAVAIASVATVSLGAWVLGQLRRQRTARLVADAIDAARSSPAGESDATPAAAPQSTGTPQPSTVAQPIAAAPHEPQTDAPQAPDGLFSQPLDPQPADDRTAEGTPLPADTFIEMLDRSDGSDDPI